MNCFNADYLILEGLRNVELPKILYAKNVMEIQEDMQVGGFYISVVVSTRLSTYLNLPIINAVSDAPGIVDLIVVNSLKTS